MLEEVTEPHAHGGALEPRGEQSLEQRLRGVRLLGHVGQSALEYIRSPAHAPAHEVQHGRPMESAEPGRPARGGGALEVVRGVGVAGVGGREAELEQDLGQHAVVRALGHRPLQVTHRGRGIAKGLRTAGGGAKGGARPVTLAGVAHEQVGGDRHRVGVAVEEHPRGLLVCPRALDGRQVVLDGRPQDRVGKAQARRAGHEPGALQRGEGVGGGVLGHVGHRRDVPERHVVLTEHRQRPRDRAAGARHSLQPQQDRRAHRVGAERRHPAGAGGRGLDALGAHLAHELLQQERVAARRVVARLGEGRV